MDNINILSWNVRGLNTSARRDEVRLLVDDCRASIVCLQWWTTLCAHLPAQKRKGFDTLFALVTWYLWKERNARVFRNTELQPNALLRSIRQDGESWIAAGATKLGCLFSV